MSLSQGEHRLSWWEMLKAQWGVIYALMLHDIRSRFGGNALGFLMMGVGWPLTHILLLLIIYTRLGRTAPYGDSTALWFATGVIPFMAFQYTSRFISLALILNRPLLYFPVVKPADIQFARGLIECLNAFLVVIIMYLVFWLLGINAEPRHILQATLALLSMMLLGLGFGIVSSVITMIFPFWITGYALLIMVFWIASGILFVPDSLPSFARVPLSYFPPLQGVEWMRSAYYSGYGAIVLDKTYLISFATVTLFLGLLLERFVRGRMLQ